MGGVLRLDGAKATAVSRTIPGVLLDARAEVDRQLGAAAERATALLAAARSEAEAIREQARAAGREEGLAAAAAALVAAARERDRLLASVEEELAGLAVEIAARVAGAAARREGAVAVESARCALASVRGRGSVTVRVSPRDLEAVRRAGLDTPSRVGVAIVGDEGVAPGGALVETDAGAVDARIETRLAALARALEDRQP